jgi:hypothetical protein
MINIIMIYKYKFYFLSYIFSNIDSIKLILLNCYNFMINKKINNYNDNQNDYGWFVDLDK